MLLSSNFVVVFCPWFCRFCVDNLGPTERLDGVWVCFFLVDEGKAKWPKRRRSLLLPLCPPALHWLIGGNGGERAQPGSGVFF